jgi:hypothetical protein
MRPAAAALVLPVTVAVAALVLPATVAAIVAGCTLPEDPPAPYTANPLGNGQRISDVQNPGASTSDYTQAINNANGVNVFLSSVVVTWIDDYDETRDGKSKGTVYVQDVGSEAPYAGISIYQPNYIPASLLPVPGDVLDISGPYQELKNIGTAIFGSQNNIPLTLPQLAKPVGTYRYDARSEWAASGGGWPDAATIQLSDIDQTNYLKGRQWEGMLVTVKDITVAAGTPDSTGNRITYPMGQADASIDPNAAAISNELCAIGKDDYPPGTHFSSVTGIVTWFYSYHIAPRTKDDLKP